MTCSRACVSAVSVEAVYVATLAEEEVRVLWSNSRSAMVPVPLVVSVETFPARGELLLPFPVNLGMITLSNSSVICSSPSIVDVEIALALHSQS
ncbi:hypothetical protein BC832DRAFT_390125 [Gaertneriomyces semiglobifer]|nr:hypothetical protein BC832DRAFT_390125 [Gaertneriomyces semiglobifer]